MRKRKNLLRAVKLQKVLVVELLCSTRCAGHPALGTVLTASSDHEGQVTYSPFRLPKVYIRLKGISTRTICRYRESPFALFAPLAGVAERSSLSQALDIPIFGDSGPTSCWTERVRDPIRRSRIR